jgi:hypothetical protein
VAERFAIHDAFDLHANMVRMLLFNRFAINRLCPFENAMNGHRELGIVENIVIVIAEPAREASPRGDADLVSRFYPLNRPNIDAGRFRERVLRHVLGLTDAANPKAEELRVKEDWSLRHGDLFR